MSSNKRKRTEDMGNANKKHETQPNFFTSNQSFSDISTAYEYLRSIFPIERFNNRVPVIVWRHQLYALFNNRTLIDRQLNKWCESAYIRFFRLGTTVSNNEVAIVLMNDYQEFVAKRGDKTIIIDRFLKKVIYEKSSTQLSSNELKNEYKFNDENISELIRCGLLARHRNSGIFLLSIPSAGEFVKSFDFGKKALISIIKKMKYKEISKSDLLKRKLPKNVVFSVEYHVYDLIGSDFINCVETSTDTILRMC